MPPIILLKCLKASMIAHRTPVTIHRWTGNDPSKRIIFCCNFGQPLILRLFLASLASYQSLQFILLPISLIFFSICLFIYLFLNYLFYFIPGVLQLAAAMWVWKKYCRTSFFLKARCNYFRISFQEWEKSSYMEGKKYEFSGFIKLFSSAVFN